MKKILGLIVALGFLTACNKNEVELLFGKTPEERVVECLSELSDKLLESEGGWKASLTTDGSDGAFGFYIKFNEDQTLIMVSDINDQTAREPAVSTYRLKWGMNASLIFDSYNYITLLQDPTPDVIPGNVRADGLKSDIEFEYIRSTADSIILEGRKYQNELILTKVTPDEMQKYSMGGYADAIAQFQLFFEQYLYPYIEIGGTKVSVKTNHEAKRFSMATVGDNNPVSASASFYHTLDGVGYRSDLSILGVQFMETVFDEGDLFMMAQDGQRYKIIKSLEPFADLDDLLGAAYTGVQWQAFTIFPGTSDLGRPIVDRYVNSFGRRDPHTYVFNNGTLTLTWDKVNNRVSMAAWYRQSTPTPNWTLTYVYDYVFDEATKTYQLTFKEKTGTDFVGLSLDQIDGFLRNHPFRLGYHVDGSTLYGKITSMADPSIVMTFELLTP